mmetsp:Transcript_2056/g.5756  ORF Transcript_2056/g.5756 Transcript_2056/m.5756 type:complete len:343 (-) Transcript_2056:485-1513(-)
MGMCSSWPVALAPGKMAETAAAAAGALALRPSPATSAKVKRLWRTGLEWDTLPPSTKVMVRTPQARRARATLQPRVPAPTRRQRVAASLSVSSSGSSRHRMRRRLRSTDDSARACGSSCARSVTMRAPSLPRALRSQPTACGRLVVASPDSGSGSTRTRSEMDLGAMAAPGAEAGAEALRLPGASRQHTTCTYWGVPSCARTHMRRLRRGHPGCAGSRVGSLMQSRGAPRTPCAASAHHALHCSSEDTSKAPRSSATPPLSPTTSPRALARATKKARSREAGADPPPSPPLSPPRTPARRASAAARASPSAPTLSGARAASSGTAGVATKGRAGARAGKANQ